jgi:hypothetical protein
MQIERGKNRPHVHGFCNRAFCQHEDAIWAAQKSSPAERVSQSSVSPAPGHDLGRAKLSPFGIQECRTFCVDPENEWERLQSSHTSFDEKTGSKAANRSTVFASFGRR